MAYYKKINKLSLDIFKKDLTEQSYHHFFENNPGFLPMFSRKFYYNTITGGMVVSEPFLKHPNNTFKNRYPDFMYITWDSLGSYIVFVEIEKPSSRIFIKNSTSFHSDFNKAIGQFYDWKDYITQVGDDGFKQNYLNNIYHRYSHSGNWDNLYFKFVLVHGLRSEFWGQSNLMKERARKYQKRQEHENIVFVTYDKLLNKDFPTLDGTASSCCQIDSNFKIIKELGSRTKDFIRMIKL